MIRGGYFKNIMSKFEKNVLFGRNLKNKYLKNVFSKISHKMSMGRVPTNFGVSDFFYRKFVKINFAAGDPKNCRF